MSATLTSPISFLPLEDGVTDILGKAQRGLGLADSTLAARVGVASGELDALRLFHGVSEPGQQRLALALELDAAALERIASNEYSPQVTLPYPGFFMTNTPYGEINVNAYLVWDPVTRQAAIFDTGADCTSLVAEIEREGLTVHDIFLTHTHGDHVLELDRMIDKLTTGLAATRHTRDSITVHIAEAEAGIVPSATPFQPGVTFPVGQLHIESRDTAGHSEGGTSYAIHGLDMPMIIVGDALFAGSVGGIRSDYHIALQRIRDRILSSQDNTLLAPGHGPLTTVGQEKANNPFFPEFKKAPAR